MLKAIAGRVKTISPLLWDFTCLWVKEVATIPLGIFLLLFSIAFCSTIAFTADQLELFQTQVSGMSEGNAAIIGGLLVILAALVGWILVDRMGWAERAMRITVNTEDIASIKDRLQCAVLDGPSRDEHDDLKERVRSIEEGIVRDRKEITDALRDLAMRIDLLIKKAG